MDNIPRGAEEYTETISEVLRLLGEITEGIDWSVVEISKQHLNWAVILTGTHNENSGTCIIPDWEFNGLDARSIAYSAAYYTVAVIARKMFIRENDDEQQEN